MTLITAAFAFAAQSSPSAVTVDPSVFRRQAGLSQLCGTDDDRRPGELVWLNLTPGENLPNIALTRSGASKRPLFESGIVTGVQVKHETDGYHTVVMISGAAAGATARLKLLMFTADNANGVLRLELSKAGIIRRFSCVPVQPPLPQPSGNNK